MVLAPPFHPGRWQWHVHDSIWPPVANARPKMAVGGVFAKRTIPAAITVSTSPNTCKHSSENSSQSILHSCTLPSLFNRAGRVQLSENVFWFQCWSQMMLEHSVSDSDNKSLLSHNSFLGTGFDWTETWDKLSILSLSTLSDPASPWHFTHPSRKLSSMFCASVCSTSSWQSLKQYVLGRHSFTIAIPANPSPLPNSSTCLQQKWMVKRLMWIFQKKTQPTNKQTEKR